jgi:hypothetical protein
LRCSELLDGLLPASIHAHDFWFKKRLMNPLILYTDSCILHFVIRAKVSELVRGRKHKEYSNYSSKPQARGSILAGVPWHASFNIPSLVGL